ncbi:MAG: DUF1631 family protein [Halioglobus sp.]|nr:DUF1631 family protein [Halioglobus sp.]
MAPAIPYRSMDHFHCHDCKEIDLKLGPEHIPFPCSLRELVLDRYAEPPGAGANAHPMDLDELVGYLRDIDDFSVSPWVAVMDKTEAIGDPATPSREHSAILRWLGKSLEIWEKEFPLESRLATHLRKLKPLAAALALSDERFMQPGAHPLHQLLDAIQSRAIGWQTRLDRVGTALEEQIARAIDDYRAWFANPNTDLKLVCDQFTSVAERDQARAQRMVQRVVDTESGKVRTAAAKHEAARMINSKLEKYQLPSEIGEFIKGPWYTSAQLLLLKFGMDSEHWESMSATTETLLDSLQSLEEADETRRQHIFQLVTQLPKDMRRWLLSLHHDTEAVNEAMGMVEFVHLRILRQQHVELEQIPPIMVNDDHAMTGSGRHSTVMKKWSEGQWFVVKTEGSVLRVRLVLKIEQSQQLLFTNMAGLKVLQMTFKDFDQLLIERKAAALHSGASFSLSLAKASGVDSVEILEALASAMGQSERLGHRNPASAEEPTPERTPDQTPERAPERAADPASNLESADNRGTSGESHTAGAAPAISREIALPEVLPVEPGDDAATAAEGQRKDSYSGYIEYESVDGLPQRDTRLDARAEPEPGNGDSLPDSAEDHAEVATAQPEIDTPTPVVTPTDRSAFEQEGRRFLDQASDIGSTQATQPSALATEQGETRRINLPVGVWIGFHDGEMPVMARLAVHDPQEDHFIFVNRKGVKVRTISRLEFLVLIDSGLVEILETTKNFRDVVSEVRKQQDQ